MTAPSTSEVENISENSGTKDQETVVLLSFPSSSKEDEDIVIKTEDVNDKNDVLRFTMLFNKFNSDLDLKRNSKSSDDAEKHRRDKKYSMFFNKEVTIRSNSDCQPPKGLEVKTSGNTDTDFKQTLPVKPRSKFSSQKQIKLEFGNPYISEPGMMFSDSLTHSSQIFDKSPITRVREAVNLKKFLKEENSKVKDSLIEVNVQPMRADLRVYNSLTALSKSDKLRGGLKYRIPSLTAIETSSVNQKDSLAQFGYWDHWDDLLLMHNDIDKRLNLQISRSSNDNSRQPGLKFKEETASVSDSKLLYSQSDTKKQIKKYDKKSRGDSSKKEIETVNRKQVQWNTEVDVIYFSTHLATNGDRTGEVIGRVMEPLREEWEQQRKGFYAKMVPYHMESHLKDRFISLLKI